VEPLPNGIRVQLVDDLKQKIFTKRNSSELSIFTQKFLDLIASIITQTDFKIFASAHSQKFKTQAGDSFSVWDLTAERALNIYRYLIEKGTNPENIANISAHGDYQLYIPEEPHSLQNNRISLELKLL
ncbi:MAG: OmpA family protein, partial [Pseudomonadota bacterium]